MTTVPRIQKNSLKDGDRAIEGVLIVNSGLQIGASGLKLPVINVVSQVIDFAAAGSGINTQSSVSVAFTSGATGTISSGDYIIPLTQPAESGFMILPAQAATGDSITVNILSTAAINPAAQAFKFLILKNLGV